jgi:hypothetical protein
MNQHVLLATSTSSARPLVPIHVHMRDKENRPSPIGSAGCTFRGGCDLRVSERVRHVALHRS